MALQKYSDHKRVQRMMTVKLLEDGFKKLCNIVYDESGKDMSMIKHGGAAGGVAAGLHTFLNAKLAKWY
jgi:glycerate kinase